MQNNMQWIQQMKKTLKAQLTKYIWGSQNENTDKAAAGVVVAL